MLKRFFRRWEDSMSAVAFAEAGEFDTAVEMVKEEKALFKKIWQLKQDLSLTIEDLTSMAITFAEAGEFEKAEMIMKEIGEKLAEIKWSKQRELKGLVLSSKAGSI
jgi:thioredoxin-like negative regulator of GroEL